eukprot:scaffold99903_cov58-Phaeocystis_antarctica.AAC.7
MMYYCNGATDHPKTGGIHKAGWVFRQISPQTSTQVARGHRLNHHLGRLLEANEEPLQAVRQCRFRSHVQRADHRDSVGEGDVQHRAAAAAAGDALPAGRIRARAACDGGRLAGSDHLVRQAGGGRPQDVDGAAPAAGTRPRPKSHLHTTPAPPLHHLRTTPLHSPDFASTLLSSSAHGQTFHAALHELDGRFRDLGKGSRPTSIKTYVIYLRHRLQAPQFVLIAAASAPGTSPQRRQPLGGLHLELSAWERI